MRLWSVEHANRGLYGVQRSERHEGAVDLELVIASMFSREGEAHANLSNGLYLMEEISSSCRAQCESLDKGQNVYKPNWFPRR